MSGAQTWRTGRAVVALLALAQAAAAGPHWQATSFAMEPQDLPRLLAATERLMASPVGRELPGTLSLMVSLVDGDDPATHSFLSVFDTRAEREAWFTKLQGTPAWARFLETFGPLTEPVGTSRMRFVKEWGESGPEDAFWEIHAFTVADTAAFTAALDTFLASKTGRAFPGSVVLSAVEAAGATPITHLVSVGFESEAESEGFGDALPASEDWQTYQAAIAAVSRFAGTYLIRTVKSWGPAPPP